MSCLVALLVVSVYPRYPMYEFAADMAMPLAMTSYEESVTIQRPNAEITVRSNFPESWLWDSKITG